MAERLRALLAKYAELLNLLRRLGQEDLSAAEIRATAEKMAATQEEVFREGAFLQALDLAEQGSAVRTLVAGLYRQLGRIAEENRLLLPRLQGMMALAATELSHLRLGQVAVSGYASGMTEKGTRLSGRS